MSSQWQPNLRGLVHQKVVDAITYLNNAFTAHKAQQVALNATFVATNTAASQQAAQKLFPLQGANVVGNGAVANVQAPAQGTGKGPSSLTIVGWKQVIEDGVTYYIPVFK